MATAILSAWCAVTAVGQEPPSLVDQATDDARQRLIETVMGLQVVTGDVGQSVSAALAASPDANRELRRAVLDQCQIGKPRQTSAAPVEIDAWIPIHPLQQILRQVVRDHLPALAADPLSLDAAAGPAQVGTGRAWPGDAGHDPRPGWRQCSAVRIALTRAAADEDLRQRLLGRILRIPLADRLTVGHLVRQYPGLRRCLRASVARLELGEPQFEPIGLCVQSCTLSGDQIAAILDRAVAEYGEDLAVDLAGAARSAMAEPLTVQGFAVAPPRESAGRDGIRPAAAVRPDWTARYLSVRASGQPPAGVSDEQTRRTMAIQAARIEAERRLWLDIEKLVLPEGDTVGARLAARPDRDRALAAINAAILEMAKPAFSDQGVVTVNIGIRLETVWQAVGDSAGPAAE